MSKQEILYDLFGEQIKYLMEEFHFSVGNIIIPILWYTIYKKIVPKNKKFNDYSKIERLRVIVYTIIGVFVTIGMIIIQVQLILEI